MNTIISIGDEEDYINKINLDELYEKKQQKDLKTLELYNRILSRVYKRVKLISNQRTNEQHCWFVMPETIIGVPRFDSGLCTAYILQKLTDDGFTVKYTHPNLLLISWASWCPTYVRNEIKKKTGIIVDNMGNAIDDLNDRSDLDIDGSSGRNGNNNRKNNNNNNNNNNNKYTPIENYKPSGIIYNKSVLGI